MTDEFSVFCQAVELRPIGVDDLSAVRHVHCLATRALGATQHSEAEIDACISMIRSPRYAEQVMASESIGAFFEDSLAGTAGWFPADDTGKAARITHLYVSPLFTRAGLGRFLLRAIEERAGRAGFEEFIVRVPTTSAAFFMHHGYERSSNGVQQTPAGTSLPVVFMRRRASGNELIRYAKLFGGEVTETKSDADSGRRRENV